MTYQTAQLERSAIDALPGFVALDFGANWCGYCRAAAPIIAAALQGSAQVQHLQIEDGPGRALGRSFKIKLWPTVVLLQDGVEFARVTRPEDGTALRLALTAAGAA